MKQIILKSVVELNVYSGYRRVEGIEKVQKWVGGEMGSMNEGYRAIENQVMFGNPANKAILPTPDDSSEGSFRSTGCRCWVLPEQHTERLYQRIQWWSTLWDCLGTRSPSGNLACTL
jgi:hypothetical protein